MVIITKIYKDLALLSPHIEVKLRQLYWLNQKYFIKYTPGKVAGFKNSTNMKKVDFDLILNQLRYWGVKKGSILIVHSSYDALACTGLSPIQIITKLRELVGPSGTLAMPVIRRYKEEPPVEDKIKTGYKLPICIYNLKRTPIQSGLLPMFLMRTKDAEISHHPLNSLCAVGYFAKGMMEGNIDGDSPSPHGVHSSWKFCLDHNALICSIGTDLCHHNTMSHVAEEAFGNWHWKDEEWYNWRDFILEVPGQDPTKLTVRERKPKWGMLHQAELNRYKDLQKANVLKSRTIGSVLVEFERSQELIRFLQSKNRNGYPYFK